MGIYNHILDKLNEFIRKHYTQKLIKGVLLFLAFGLLFFLVVMGVEYALWLNSTGRFLLLLLFIATETFLLFTYILTPLFYLLKIKKGITPKDAAVQIGKHFPQVGDKLYNLLDLAESQEQSELLLASIEQRSKQLNPVPFSNAITYSDALRYGKYTVIPLLLVGLVWVSGNWNSFFGSYERVVNYDLAYEPPAPFQFELLSKNLTVMESEPFTFKVTTMGAMKPENVYLVMDGKEILLQETGDGYQYTLNPPVNSWSFSFKGNDVRSREYRLKALKAPAIVDFNINLDYPAYLNKPNETLKSTGNALMPEGTKVTWQITGADTENIRLITTDTTLNFAKKANAFELSKRVYSDLGYQLTTSNSNVSDYEKLDYAFKVIKDEYPTVNVLQVLDSLNPNVSYYSGEAADDYGVSKVDLVYYDVTDAESTSRISITEGKSNFTQFYYTFPSGLALEPSKDYEFYFLVTDNDGLRKGKTVKSQVFKPVHLDDNQLKNRELESKQQLIDNLDNTLEKAKEQEDALQKLNDEQKEKNNLNFNDKNQVKDFLKKQERQEELMQKFSKELKENLNKSDKDDKLNQLLQERLERQELEARKNEKLLEELNKIADKINKEELTKRLEEVAKKQKNSQRSLEQLVELTKRYYVTEKAAQLAKDLEKLAERQEILSDLNISQDFSEKEQKKLNQSFEKLAKELEELQNDNQELQKPIALNINEDKKQGVRENQQKALEEIKKHQGNEQSSDTEKMEQNASSAKKNQKSAAQKMKELSEALSKSSSSGGGGSSVAEDAEMLRQILDNLIIFSFKQETLFDKLSVQDPEDVSQYGATVRDQNELRGLFAHVDDSLFSLSLRQAELSEFVNEQITEVYYNIDKSLESMAEGQMYQGVSYQKYVLTAANSLADFLANVLENMNQSMQPGQGEGDGDQDFQLPDIIKGQQSLGEKMGKEGEEGQQGSEGKEGEQGQKGNEGEQGQQGQGGENGQEGKEGKGENGEGKGEGKGGQRGENGKGQGSGNGDGDSGGNGKGLSEAELQEIYEIYQEQQRIRQELEKQLENLINTGDRKLGEKLVRQMEDFENDLLENGITQRTINKANTIQYELLKLENAALKQGKKSERESNANQMDFTNPITTKPSLLENYRNEVEILNRQALPLRQNFQNKVKAYFKGDD
ncbi:hypothetical protein ACFQZJ_19645 [Maribacter chungangensis]|uniref:DUF4175 family protein n=1 Tax=Maribacter chungangensis TaxID=1069117 RepID=A0ABW3BA39_9FLAO